MAALVVVALTSAGGEIARAATDPSFVAPSPARVTPGLTSASAGTDASYTPSGRIIADSRFRPWVDGFAFENYDNAAPPVNLTPVQIQDLFGPQVCISGSGSDCVLIPPMQQWMEAENAKMSSGHCVGFSVTALRMFQKTLSPSAFGAATPQDLQIRDNPALQSRIAEGWSYQQLPSVYGALVEGRPSKLLTKLQAALRNPAGESYTIGITNASGAGHAITPFAIEATGRGRVNVLVYDNNYPGITRKVEFDTRRETWVYHGDRNPGNRAGLYSGSAARRTMFLLPTSPGTRRQPCPSCASIGAQTRTVGDAQRVSYDQISLVGDPANHGHLLLTDRRGRRTGFVGGRIINRIPGVHVVRHLAARNWRSAPEPTYRVPVGTHVKVVVDGSDLDEPTVEKLTLIGPHNYLSVHDIHLRPGQRDRFRFRPGGGAMEYVADVRRRALSPTMTAAVTEGKAERRAAYELTVASRNLRGRLDLLLRNDRSRGTFMIDTRTTTLAHGNAKNASLRITLERLSADGRHAGWTASVPVRPEEIARVKYRGTLDPARPIPVTVIDDHGHRSTILAHPTAAGQGAGR